VSKKTVPIGEIHPFVAVLLRKMDMRLFFSILSILKTKGDIRQMQSVIPVKNGSKSAHFCSFLLKKCALLRISGHFRLIFYHIFLAYITQAIHTNRITFVFSRKTKIGLKITSKFSAKNPIFSKKPPVFQLKKKRKAAK